MLNVSEFAPRENELIAREITHHPVDDLEPIPDDPTPYRTAAIECMRILASVDLFMTRAADARLAWTAVSCAIGLTSTHGLAQAEIGRQLDVTELSVRRLRLGSRN